MRIDRIQIEEGFLDGLDVSFVPGLNVIIGARGTGKTSLIELGRFCLGVPSYTRESGRRSLDHALSVLGSGQVTVTLSDGEREVLVSRTATEDSPRASGPFVLPIVFSQTEIETVGLREEGRIRLLDTFVNDLNDSTARESDARSEVRSLTAEAEAHRREIDELAGLVREIPSLDEQIADHMPQEQEVAKVSADAREEKRQLDLIVAEIAARAVGVDAIERFHRSVLAWHSSLARLSSAPPVLEAWPESAGSDPLARCRVGVERAKQHLGEALRELQNALSGAESHSRASQEAKLKVEGRARQSRKQVESLQEGAGAIARKGQRLRERRAQLESLNKMLAERRKAIKAPLVRRDAALERLDSIRENRFSRRNAAAKELSQTLGPRIRATVSRSGQFEAFAAAIADALRGSGLRYNELSSTLAESVSPRELLEAVDANDFDLISDAAGITKARAARVLDRLRESDLGALATVTVEDTVRLQLLDGTDYKSIADLSTGQRCTVILPLVLRHTERVLIVDQPEDHIDNAFIADTLITSVLARQVDGQMIFSTHNANIPVLGNADRVIQLGSDGRRGYPVQVSNLDDPAVVKAITTLMEGGAEAFKRRAAFYGRHGAP